MEDSVIFTSDAELLAYWKNIIFEQKKSVTNEASSSTVEKLFETYQRLRQIPRLITCLLQAITSLEDEERFSLSFEWTTVTLERFALCCQEFPPGQMFEIWTTLISGADEKLIPMVTNCKPHSSSRKIAEVLVKIWTDLFSVFLMHCRLLHYSSMPLSSTAKAEFLMAATASQCVAPLFDAYLRGDTHVGSCALSLCYSWGELSLLLQQYWSKFATVRGSLKKSAYDLSYVHPMIPREKWKEFATLLEKQPDISIHNMNVLLLLQKFRAIMQLKGNFETKNKYLVVTAEAVGLLITDLHENDFQSGSLIPVWQCVLSQLPVLLPFWSLDVCLKVAKKIVELANNCPNKQLQEMALLAVGNLNCTESNYFQTAIVSAILENLFSILTKAGVNNMKHLGNLLCDLKLLVPEGGSFTSFGNSPESWSSITESGNILNSMLENSKAATLRVSSPNMNCISKHLKIFQLLPLSYLLPINQTRCLFGVLAALSTVQACSGTDASLQFKVIECGRQIIVTILDGFRSVWLFDFVNAGSVLCWLVDSQVRCITQTYCKSTDLLYKTFKSCLSSLLRLSINNRRTFMTTTTFFDRLENLKKTFKELSADGKYVYIVVANCTINVLMMVFKRSYKYKAIKETCETHLSVITRVINSMMKRLPKEGVHSRHVRSALLQSFAQVIEVAEELLEKQKPVKWRKHLRFAFDEALKVLQNDLDDEILVESCFEFVRVVVQHRQQCEDVFSENFIHYLWIVTASAHAKFYWKLTGEILRSGDSSNMFSISALSTLSGTGFDNSLVSATERLVISLMLKSSAEELEKVVEDLSGRLQTNEPLDVALPQLLSAFRLLYIFPYGQLALDNEKITVLSQHLSHIVTSLPSLLYSYQHEGVKTLEYVLIPMLQLMGQIIVPQGQNIPCTNVLNMCFHICAEVLRQSQSSSLAVFEKTVIAICELFNALLFHCKFDVIKMMPAFSSGLMNLLQVVICRSDQSKLSSEDDIDNVVCASQYVNRLLNCMSQERRKDFCRVAPYIVAEFVSEIQKITVIPSVKDTLSSGMFNILSLCDAYSIALLQSNLPHSNRELFNEFLHTYKNQTKTRAKK